jgi:hypothetical protein
MLDFLSNYSAQIIAACALAFTGWSAYAQRKHNVLSVQPYLTTFTYHNKESGRGYLKVELLNNGLGPAYINKFEIYLNKELCEFEKAVEHATKGIKAKYQKTSLDVGYAMPAGGKQNLFSINFPCETDEEMEAVEKQLNELDVSIGYQCAYGKVKNMDTFKKG